MVLSEILWSQGTAGVVEVAVTNLFRKYLSCVGVVTCGLPEQGRSCVAPCCRNRCCALGHI